MPLSGSTLKGQKKPKGGVMKLWETLRKVILLGASILLLLLSIVNFSAKPLKGGNGWDAVYVPKVHDCWEKYKVDCIIVTSKQ